MKLFKRKSLVTAELHIGFWLCYIILVGVILGALYGTRQDVDEEKIAETIATIILFAMIPSAVALYSFHFLIFPRLIQQKNIWITIFYGLMISLLAGLLGYFLLYLVHGGQCLSGNPDDESEPISLTLFIAFISLIAGVIGLVMDGFVTWFNEIKLKEELKQKNHEMEIALVKSQLDPHFLFNTINNIDVLIIKNAEEASDYLNKLSDIMRFMLFETKSDEIPLEKEIEYIKKYIDLQKIRTSNLNYINFEVEGEIGNREIAPMVFIPFIENAFKHTTNKKLKNAISVRVIVDKNAIKLECINKIDPNRKLQQESNGLGNELIQKRLNLIYPERHLLEILNENNTYHVYLSIEDGKA